MKDVNLSVVELGGTTVLARRTPGPGGVTVVPMRFDPGDRGRAEDVSDDLNEDGYTCRVVRYGGFYYVEVVCAECGRPLPDSVPRAEYEGLLCCLDCDERDDCDEDRDPFDDGSPRNLGPYPGDRP